MDFRDIGFTRFIKHCAEKHILENALREAYNAGYEDGWRSKLSKEIKASPKNIMFVFDEDYDCFLIIKESLLDHIIDATNNKVSMDDGSIFYIYNAEHIKNGVLCDTTLNKVYISNEIKHVKKVEAEILRHLTPMRSEMSYLSFEDFKTMNFEEVWHGL